MIKRKVYLGLSIAIFIATMFFILNSISTHGILNDTLSIQWIILLILTLLMPIFNFAEIIVNRDESNKLYWIGLVVNILTIIFVMRYFEIEIDFIKLFQE